MKAQALITALVLTSIGCATDPSTENINNDVTTHEVSKPVTVDDGIDDHFRIQLSSNLETWQMEMIIQASNAWALASNHTIQFTYEVSDFDPNSYVPDWATFSVGIVDDLGWQKDRRVLGHTDWWIVNHKAFPDKATIKLLNMSHRKFYLTALHEIGHALGLPHSEDQNSIMQSVITDVGTEVTCVDQVTLCKTHMCIAPCTK